MPAVPQPVVVVPSEAAIVLVMTIAQGKEQAARAALGEVTSVIRAVCFRYPDAATTCVAGIGSDAWDRLFPGEPKPNGLHPFVALQGDVHHAPSTPGDLVFHIRGQRFDLCFELAHQLAIALDGIAVVEDELQGFRYFDERDLLGFVDGTESPTGVEADAAAYLADGPFAGGSYLIVQRYLHDLPGWNRLSVEEQERAIGRHKLDDIEIPDAHKAANAHVALTVLTAPDGTERQIVRENMPFGSVGSGEFGTYFIGYAADVSAIEDMLRNMFIGDPPGNHDRILDFSTAVTGSLFFIPTIDFLDALGEA